MDDALLIDAGTGNLHSVYNALASLGYSIRVTSDPMDVARGGRVILPGVGAFGKFMQGVVDRGLGESLKKAAFGGDPLLGICVGMQAFFEVGEEQGEFVGLGLFEGRVLRFPDLPDLKVPHTGWNQLWPTRTSPLFTDIQPGSYVYFNHSYYCSPVNHPDIAATTDYGTSFVSVVQHENWFGVQFHPEKSQHIGAQILKNFMELT